MRESDLNLTAVRQFIISLNQFRNEVHDFKKYISDVVSKTSNSEDVGYALVAIENKITQINGIIELANGVLEVNKKNLISANFLLEESYVVNQRVKEIRVEGAYSLADNGNQNQNVNAPPAYSTVSTGISKLNESRKKAIQIAKSKFQQYSTPIIAAAILGTTGVGAYTHWDQIQDYQAKAEVNNKQMEKERQEAREKLINDQDAVLRKYESLTPGLADGVKAARLLSSSTERDETLERLVVKYKDTMKYEQLEVLVENLMSYSHKKDLIKAYTGPKDKAN